MAGVIISPAIMLAVAAWDAYHGRWGWCVTEAALAMIMAQLMLAKLVISA